VTDFERCSTKGNLHHNRNPMHNRHQERAAVLDKAVLVPVSPHCAAAASPKRDAKLALIVRV